jgi:anti-sigma factor RsiW
MTQSSLPDNWQELMAGYVLGDLNASEVEEFGQLLTTHPDLMAEVQQLQETLALMPYALPPQPPPVHLRSSILQTAAAELATGQSLAARPTPPQPRRGQLHWLTWGGMVAALLVVVLGVDNYRLRQQLHENQAATSMLQQSTVQLRQQIRQSQAIISALQQSDVQFYRLQGANPSINASARLIVNPDHQQMVLLTEQLPPLSENQIYRLWAIRPQNAAPIYCGQFNSPSQRTNTIEWSIPEKICSSAVSQVLVTVEAVADPPIPKGSLVLRSVL